MKKFLPQVKINLYTSTFIPKVEAYKLILIYERSLSHATLLFFSPLSVYGEIYPDRASWLLIVLLTFEMNYSSGVEESHVK